MAMQNIHLAPEGENEDLYSGYDYNDPMFEVGSLSTTKQPCDSNNCAPFYQELEEDPEFQRIVRTRYGQRPPLPVSSAKNNCNFLARAYSL